MQQEIWFQKYKILGLLGRGGTAKVYLAEHISLNSYRAIKFISKNHPFYELQRKEAFILKSLKHSCIPIIYDIEENEEGSYIVEQYLEGDTLKEYVKAKGALCEAVLIQFTHQLCDLLHFLHSTKRPILYLDLKPENIIIQDSTLKLIDFGSAVYLDENEGIQSRSGTRGYAAPELYGSKQLDERCDVYGIGMLMYYMATGRSITGDSEWITNIDQSLAYSKKLKKVINQCLKFNPSQRYPSVEQLKKQLSAMERKTCEEQESSIQLTIAIAGAQPRIGVTHLSFRLCSYLSQKQMSYVYQEKNDSGCVRSMKKCFFDMESKAGAYIIEGILMQPYSELEEDKLSNRAIQVQDYGTLTSENLAKFLKADIRLLILGAKDWEIAFSEERLRMVAEYNEIIYLFNYVNGRQYIQAAANMEHRKCYRICYEPDPFAKVTDQNGIELFEALINSWQPSSSRRIRIRTKIT